MILYLGIVRLSLLFLGEVQSILFWAAEPSVRKILGLGLRNVKIQVLFHRSNITVGFIWGIRVIGSDA